MEQRILQYRKFMEEELLRLSKEQNITEEEISRIKKEHLVQISFFQHERLVHLIVTVTFAHRCFRGTFSNPAFRSLADPAHSLYQTLLYPGE